MEAHLAFPDSFDLALASADKHTRYRLAKFTDPRRVMPELEAPALNAGGCDQEVDVTGCDKDAGSATGDVIEEELSAFPQQRYDHNGDAPGR